MTKRSPEIDRYIENAAAFAQPILKRIRKAFHEGDPDIEEAMKWRNPTFEHDGIVGGMAAFKAHVRWGFWKAKLMSDPLNLFAGGDDASIAFANVTSVDQLPPHDVIVDYVREAVRLNVEGVKAQRPARKKSEAVEIPAELTAALKKNKKAKATFDAFSPSNKREYAMWIAEAKQEATRKKRIETAIEWIAEGKPRNWKYMK